MDYELLIQRVMEEVRKRLAEEEAKKAVCGKKRRVCHGERSKTCCTQQEIYYGEGCSCR